MKPPDLTGLTTAAKEVAARGLPPVHLWNPPDCGDIDMRIGTDGTWHYLGSPIGRMPLVKLFASILRKDGDRYVLVTPVERVGIRVDDAPFVAVEMREEAGGLSFRTNVEDWTSAGPDHPIRFETGASDGLKPYVHVRAGLWARVNRALFYDLMAMGVEREVKGIPMFGIASAGAFFPILPVSELNAQL